MKKVVFLFISVIFLSNVFTACDFMDTDSDLIKLEEDYKLKNPTDSLYSMFGILANLQKISDSYVLLGELRADLMDVTENSRQELLDIYNWEIKPSSKYAQVKDYYSIINNCNYVINNIDTSYISKGNKVLMKEFAGAKSIRAWTYMQLVLNFKTATYYTSPILKVSDLDGDYPEVTMAELAPLLIEDLLPYANELLPRLGVLGSQSLTYSFFPIKMLLGDLYLWSEQYQEAALMYASLIKQRKYVINDNYQSYWMSEGGALTDGSFNYWHNSIHQDDERISGILNSTEYDYPSEIYNMCFPLEYSTYNTNATYELRPSVLSLKNWFTKLYYADSYSIPYDLRINGTIDNGSVSKDNISNEGIFIEKFNINARIAVSLTDKVTNISVYRTPLLYLRYAEAVNRLGKPNLAFAVIKNGLSSATLSSRKLMTSKEVLDPIESYMDFTDVAFKDNIGTCMRGQAVKTYVGSYIDVRKAITDTTFIIPALTNLSDSIEYVEDLIVGELSLETAFDGNRFQDLMRVALRRSPAYLADKIAEKYEVNKESIRTKLLSTDNWYLPFTSIK